MKKALIFFIFFNSKIFAQISKDSSFVMPSNYDTIKLNFGNSYNAHVQIQILSDSLNKLSRSERLPSFLFDECFDYQTVYWPNLHTPISLRKMIVKGVYNKQVLLRLSKDKRLNKVCKQKNTLKVPYLKKSYQWLFKEQLLKIQK